MHGTTIAIVGVAILLYGWIIRRRLGTYRRNADIWFKPSGSGYIYHPRGRWGRAYFVTAEQRDRIRKANGQNIGILVGVIAVFYLGPLLFFAYDPLLYRQFMPQIGLLRLGALAVLLVVFVVMHRFTVRPIYAGAPISSERISMREVRTQLAARASWGSLIFRIIVSLIFVVTLPTMALRGQGNLPMPLLVAGVLLFGFGLIHSIRLALLKANQR